MKRILLYMFLVCLAVMTVACGKDKTPDIPDVDDSKHGGIPNDGKTNPDPSTDTKAEAYDLYLSEVMADNRKLYLNTDSDWIEIGSREDNVVSLNGYYLTDDKTKPHAYPLAGNVIEQNGFVVVLLPKEAPFRLSGEGETIYLIRNDEIADTLTYTEEIGDRSASKDGVLPYATPGYANTQEGYEAYMAGVKLAELIFTEAMSDNTQFSPVNGQYYDFVELKNNTDHAIRLSDFYLSDKRSDLTKYRLPDRELGAGEYVVIYCSGLEADGHAPFKISGSGEALYLSDGVNLVDMIDVPGDLEKNKSYGRNDNRFVYMEDPTPGAANNSGFEARVAAPVSDVKTGVYESAVNVTLSGEGTIYYTTDGSMPTLSSKTYTGAINVTGVTTIRAIAVKDGRQSSPASFTYVINQNHTLPILVVNGPRDGILGDNGVVKQISKRELEAQAMMTLIENGEEKFSVPCGIKLHGNDSRKMEKQNFTVHFRSSYGASKLKYKLFDDIDINSFNSILLKGGSERFREGIIEDEFMTHMVLGNTNLSAQASKPVVLYLCGEFWGIYFMRERFSADYVADHFDVNKDTVNLINGYGSYAEAENGSRKDFDALVSFAKTNDLNKDENYDYLAGRIDLNSLFDWYICRGYYGDSDLANIRYFAAPDGDNKWRWMFFDLDWGFCVQSHVISTALKNDGNHVLAWKITHSKRGQDAFLKRVAYLLDTILNEEYITKEIDSWKAILEPEIAGERSRWGGSANGWNSSLNVLYNYVKDNKRDMAVLKDLKSMFGLTDAQMKEYFGSHWTP